MKNTLLALALLAFTGTAALAHEGHDGKNAKGKKETCSKEAAAHCSKGGSVAGGLPACCMNKGKAKTTAAATTTDAKATPAAKSL